MRLMRPWISGAGTGALSKYLPKMFEVRFKSESDMDALRESVGGAARFITHNDAVRPSITAGWKMIAILVMLLGIIIGTIGICVSLLREIPQCCIHANWKY